MKVSVIVSDVNEQGMRLPCIQMLCNQHFDEYEVIFPDGGIWDLEDRTMIEDFQKQYSHLKVFSVEGKNRAELINEAVRRARGELLLFIESHCIADRDWVKNYSDLFKKRRIQAARGDVNTIPTDTWEGIAEEYMRGIIVRRIGSLGTAVSYFDFHNSAMTKKCFVGLGGLSPDLPILAEFELGARAHQKGIGIYQFKTCKVWHANSTRFSKYAEVIGEQGREKALLINKHGKEFVAKYFPAPKLLGMLPLLKVFRLPLLLAVRCAMSFAKLGFYTGKMINSHDVANFYFVMFANNSYRYGILIGLGQNRHRS